MWGGWIQMTCRSCSAVSMCVVQVLLVPVLAAAVFESWVEVIRE
jgi:hypothetical protein